MAELVDPDGGHGPEQLEVGFISVSAAIVIPQIQRLSLTNRSIGLESIVNLCDSGSTEELAGLLEQGLFPLLLAQFTPTNLPIIGLVATAFRRLSGVFPDAFQAVVPEIPIAFLLSVPNSTEVVDLLQHSALNSDEFAGFLLSAGDALAAAVGGWLQAREPMARAALELLATLAEIPGAPFDFACVKPLTDGGFPADVRALALDVLLKADAENAPLYVEHVLALFYHEAPTPTVVQVTHDVVRAFPGAFAGAAEPLLLRALEAIAVPEAAILVADIAPQLAPPQREEAVARIFGAGPLCIERVDSVFRFCKDQAVVLPPPLLLQLLAELETGEDSEVLDCVEAILGMHAQFFAEPEVQERLTEALDRQPEFAVHAFRVCLACCAAVPLAPELLEAFSAFAAEVEQDFDEELHAEVAV